MSEADSESLPDWLPADEGERVEAMGTASVGIRIPEHGQIALLEAIESDPGRNPFERESRLLWRAGTDVLDIYAAEPGVMRRLVLHPHFRLQRLEVATEQGTRSMECEEFESLCSGTDSPPMIPSVYSISGIAHVGLQKIAETPRTTGGHAQIITSAVLDNDPRKDQ